MRHSKGRAPGQTGRNSCRSWWRPDTGVRLRDRVPGRILRNWPDGGTFTEKGMVRASVLNGLSVTDATGPSKSARVTGR